MGLLEAARIKGNREAVNGIGQEVAKNHGRFGHLGQKNIHGPDRVAAPSAEFYEEHFAADELVDLSALQRSVVTARVFGPDVGFFFELAGHLDKSCVIGGHDIFDSHGEAVAVENFAGFANAYQKNTAAGTGVLAFDSFAYPGHEFFE